MSSNFERIWLKKNSLTKKLFVGLKKSTGRSDGRITVRHKGGGVKRRLPLVDFRRAL